MRERERRSIASRRNFSDTEAEGAHQSSEDRSFDLIFSQQLVVGCCTYVAIPG